DTLNELMDACDKKTKKTAKKTVSKPEENVSDDEGLNMDQLDNIIKDKPSHTNKREPKRIEVDMNTKLSDLNSGEHIPKLLQHLINVAESSCNTYLKSELIRLLHESTGKRKILQPNSNFKQFRKGSKSNRGSKSSNDNTGMPRFNGPPSGHGHRQTDSNNRSASMHYMSQKASGNKQRHDLYDE
ncbi:MAG: hypothetical protein RLZZ546_1381, partial [Bacteroidota bacterium]